MRIVAGRWAGRSLTSPSGRVRPTSEAMRAAIMTMLSPHLAGARILDLFAGSGALGLEALSHGAASCDFVENGPSALHALKANVAALRVKNRVRIFDRDAIPFVERLTDARYDIAFADPPYGSKKLDRIVERWLSQPYSQFIVLEHAPEHKLPARGERLRIEDSVMTVLCKGPGFIRSGI